jgi:bifunctional non-homologous end joining protein LigD
MSLTEYKRKRHFNRTPEPAGKPAPADGHLFVIQKHDARQLHYDFRLELDGVLKSWAVPKGPSLDPSIKRLAMHVEDHPVEYGSFEGIIPEGEYGGGTVLLWDKGTWEPLGDARQDYEKGRLKFKLHGEKLQGAWMLLRTNPGQYGTGKRGWLLFKERDDQARPAVTGDVLEELPLSVETGRTLDEIAADKDWVWSTKSNSNQQRKPTARTKSLRQKKKTNPSARTRGKTKTPESAQQIVVKMLKYDARAQELAGVRLTSPEKVLYPEAAITKLELAAYYQYVSKWMLPHLIDRPIVLVRCPEGHQHECFYQKHPAAGTPDNLRKIPIREEKETKNYLIVDDVQGLISLAQIAALEIHAWGSRADKLDQPDRLIFDLDPDPAVPWGRVVESARQVRLMLQELGLESFIKTTGGKGLHLVIPIDRRHDWKEAKTFCRQVAELIVRLDHAHFTANMSIAQRTGKIYIDYVRNGRGATAIAPYSPRTRSGAPISVPLAWDELTDKLRSDHFTVRNIANRLETLKDDPWKAMKTMRQSLAGAIKKLQPLVALKK